MQEFFDRKEEVETQFVMHAFNLHPPYKTSRFEQLGHQLQPVVFFAEREIAHFVVHDAAHRGYQANSFQAWVPHRLVICTYLRGEKGGGENFRAISQMWPTWLDL